jgi:MOSC domain-containing protein
MTAVSVAGLAITPVKGMRIAAVEQIELGEWGARGNRVFYVVDDRARLVNGKQLGALHTIVPEYDPDAGTLALTFPDGSRAAGTVQYDATVATRFFSQPRDARKLRGPWSEALSAFVGRPLTLVEAEIAVDRGREGSTSIISRSSLRRLADIARRDAVDARRFRMLIEIDGVGAHEEDGWVGRRVRVGEATLAMHGHVGRCLTTSRDPESGDVDLPTLDVLGSYRRELDSTEPLPFGIYGEVLQGGTVRLGDAVELADE